MRTSAHNINHDPALTSLTLASGDGIDLGALETAPEEETIVVAEVAAEA